MTMESGSGGRVIGTETGGQPPYEVPRIDLVGTPFEIGLQYGTLLRTQIHSQLRVYAKIFRALSGREWSSVLALAEELGFEETIRVKTPELFEEMRGIARGASVSLREVVVLNARSEIALGTGAGTSDGHDRVKKKEEQEGLDGCTSLAWSLEGADGKRQILAQNWDWTEEVGRNLALASIAQEGKPKIWMVMEAGIVGKIGFNSSSVGVCLNAIRSRIISPSLLPIHVLLRIALQCTSVAHAISEIERLGPGSASAQHVLIADARSGGRCLELSPKGNVYLDPDEHGIATHTNHFLENRYVEEVPWEINSHGRLARVRELVEQLRSQTQTSLDEITPRLLRERVFADKQGAPYAICCYKPKDATEETEGRVSSTLFNIVMQFASGKEPKAEVLFGRPGLENTGPVYTMPW